MKIPETDVQVAVFQKITYIAAVASGFFGLTLQDVWWVVSILLGAATYITSLYFQIRKDRREERELLIRLSMAQSEKPYTPRDH